jgi:hypothetical protein
VLLTDRLLHSYYTMVGKRAWAESNALQKTTSGTGPHRRKPERSVSESPNAPAKPKALRFQDRSTDIAEEIEWREHLKHKLLNSVDRGNLESYRKSDEEVC